MPSHPAKGSLAIVPLALTSVALIGFLLTNYWQQQRDYQALQQELALTRTNAKQQFEQIGSQATLRHTALVKMSEDVAVLREQVESLQATLKDQTGDIARQGQKLTGQVDRLDLTTQQQLRTLEGIKVQLKERTDAFVAAMLKQERELAVLSSERAAALAASAASSSTNSVPPPTTPASTLPPVVPVPTSTAIAATPNSAATNSVSKPIAAIAPTPLAPPQYPVAPKNPANNLTSLPLPPVVPDLGGAGSPAVSNAKR